MVRFSTRTLWASFLLALAVGLVVLSAACGDDDEEAADGSETPTASAEPSDSQAPADEASQTAFEIKMIPTLKFDQTELSIPADEAATITADNTDEGTPHNFAIYASQESAEGGEDSLVATEICVAPCTDEAAPNLPAGEYFFRCDVHPNQMTGTLTVGDGE